MFTLQMSENITGVVSISGIEKAEVFEEMIRFIYLDELSLKARDISLDLFKAADMVCFLCF